MRSATTLLRPLRLADNNKRRKPVTRAQSDIPQSFEESVSQACLAIRQTLYGGKRKARKAKSLRRLIAEIPTLDTSVDNALYLTSQFIDALEFDGRSSTSVIYFREDITNAAQKKFPNKTVLHINTAFDLSLTSRLLLFNPVTENENAVLELLQDVWRGESVLLFNPDFSDAYEQRNGDFLKAFDTVYCFMPLAIRIFLQNKEGALFRWQNERGVDSKWRIFIQENGEYKQIGQQASRPTQDQLEAAVYNATAAESLITKSVKFLRSLGAKNKT